MNRECLSDFTKRFTKTERNGIHIKIEHYMEIIK